MDKIFSEFPGQAYIDHVKLPISGMICLRKIANGYRSSITYKKINLTMRKCPTSAAHPEQPHPGLL